MWRDVLFRVLYLINRYLVPIEWAPTEATHGQVTRKVCNMLSFVERLRNSSNHRTRRSAEKSGENVGIIYSYPVLRPCTWNTCHTSQAPPSQLLRPANNAPFLAC